MQENLDIPLERKIEPLKKRILTALRDNHFYDIHQIYKAIFHRCCTFLNYKYAIHYLHEGLCLLIDNKQFESAQDILKSILKLIINDRKIPIDMQLINYYIENIYVKLGQTDSGEIDREHFISEIIKYIRQNRQCNNAPDLLLLHHLHDICGRQLWKEKNFSTSARTHLVKTGDGFIFGIYLIDTHQLVGFKSEIELFLAQAVLQCLCLQKLQMAAKTYLTYVKRHPHLNESHGPPFDSYPILNFLWFLMIAIDRKLELSSFQMLCEKYQLFLTHDETYCSYLEKIAIIYFGVLPNESARKANRTNNWLNMLKIFTDDEDKLSVDEEMD